MVCPLRLIHRYCAGGGRGASVKEVVVCVNETARQRFEAKRAELAAAGKPINEIWVFHGTSTQQNIDNIVSSGFRVGGTDGVPIANGAVHGNGVYAATGPATPMKTYAGGTSKVILCRALPGKEGWLTHMRALTRSAFQHTTGNLLIGAR